MKSLFQLLALLCAASAMFAQQPEILSRRANAFVFQEGYSVTFDGVDEYIACADHDDFSFTDGSGNDAPFSLFIWMNRATASTNQTLISKYGQGREEYILTLIGSSIRIICLTSITHYIGRSAPLSTTGTWIGIAMTYDGSESSTGLKLYSVTASGAVTQIDNGNLNNGSYTGMGNKQAAFRVGAYDHESTWYFDGKLAFPLIADKALSVAELTEAAIVPNGDYRNVSFCDNIISAWFFENGTTDYPTYTDYKSGRNGTLTNMQESNISIDKPE